MRNYIQAGNVVTVTAPEAVTAGRGVQVGVMFGVATADAANGSAVMLFLNGVFDLAKATGQAWAVGSALYWDNTAKVVTTTVGSNLKIGVCQMAAASADVAGRVRLNGVF